MRSQLDWSEFNYNNVHTLDFKGADYLIFYPEKQLLFFRLPSIIKGNPFEALRRHISTFICLNPDQSNEVYREVLKALNINSELKLSDLALDRLLEDALLLKDSPELKELIELDNSFNRTHYRRYVINPDVPKSKKASIKGVARGEYLKLKTQKKIRTTLESWSPYWGKPTNRLIASKANLSIKQVSTYMPELKAERQRAATLKKAKPANKTLRHLANTLLNWDENLGKPTNKNLSKITGIGLSTIEGYSPKLKGLKKKIRDNKTTFFDAFDSKNFIVRQKERELQEVA